MYIRDPEKNRRRALAAYHADAERINAVRRGKSLAGIYRRALARSARRTADNLHRLQAAAQSVVKKFNRRVESRLLRCLRRRFENAIRLSKRKSDWVHENTGIELAGLRRHLESQFRPGMTWANHSFEGWHIDHIKPLAKFDLSEEAQRRAAFHYTNLQPLWAKENFEKRDK